MNKKVYGNCKVLSKDGELMFLCVEKRANWYLKRNIAKKITDNPLTIQLTFEAKGKGHNGDEYYLGAKENKCCVCGDDNIDIMTKHHIIPSEFRKHLSDEFKSRSSHDVVPICNKCHAHYENNFATPYKVEIGKIVGIIYRDYEIEHKRLIRISKIAKKIMLDSKNRNLLIQSIKKFHPKITYNDIYHYAQTEYEFDFGKVVMKKIKDLQKFHEDWRQHFYENMKPKFMPVGWDIKRKIGNQN